MSTDKEPRFFKSLLEIVQFAGENDLPLNAETQAFLKKLTDELAPDHIGPDFSISKSTMIVIRQRILNYKNNP